MRDRIGDSLHSSRKREMESLGDDGGKRGEAPATDEERAGEMKNGGPAARKKEKR